MSSEKEMKVAQKAMAYDIKLALENSDKETYTVEEIKKLIDAIVAAKEQSP